MSVLYRALWSDETPPQTDPIGHAAQLFARWALSDERAEPLAAGEHTVDHVVTDHRGAGSVQRHLARTIAVIPLERDSEVCGVSLSTRDVPAPSDAEQTVWTTTVRVVRDDAVVHAWVETLMETDDLTRRYKVGRPRIVDALLNAAGAPMLEASKISSEALDVPPNGVDILAAHLQDPERTLPVIVFTEPWNRPEEPWRERADRVATRAAGVARVIRLDTAAVTALRDVLGPLAVWGGGVRTYLPGPVEPADAWRHRYFPHSRLTTDGPGVIDRLVYAVAQLSTRRRVPAPLTALTASTTEDTATDDLRAEFDRIEWELLEAQEDQQELTSELAHANGHLERLRQLLTDRGLAELFWTAHDEQPDTDDLPDEVQDTTDAVSLAQLHLAPWLSIPETAARDLAGIDSAPTALTWANTTWRGLRALAAYVQAKQAGRTGSFWEWCANSGDPFVWPATSKKLAMSESETVQNNAKLTEARTFEVDTALAEDGRLYMGAHLKIAEGGGNLAPRVYFHDDTGGSTGKVHVGFVGPHYLVPNTRT